MSHRLHAVALAPWLVFALASCGSPPEDRRGAEEDRSVKPAKPDAAPVATLEPAALRFAGPYSHENLSIFVACSDGRDDRDFLTLDEGLKAGTVAVTEKAHEQVSELEIENKDERPLFLQEGDRLQGGKQDRTLHTSMVVPPKSGRVPLPTFCVEQSRWTEGSTGRSFGNTQNAALADKSVRMAAKVDKDQGKVWGSVAEQKKEMSLKLAAPSTTSSLNETQDSQQAVAAQEGYVKALERALERHPDAVGVAIVVNGKIEEVDVYPGRALLSKLYPRLLASYALQAALRKDEKKEAEPAPGDVARFVKEGEARSRRDERVNDKNGLGIVDYEKKVACETTYDGRPVHRQMLAK